MRRYTLQIAACCLICLALVVVSLEAYGEKPRAEVPVDLPKDDRSMTLLELLEAYLLAKHSIGDQEMWRLPHLPARGDLMGWSSLVQQMLWESIRSTDARLNPYLVEFHKRFAIPCACFVFALMGVPLGIHSKRAGKSGGYAISVVLLLVYYIFITAGESLGDAGTIPAFFAAWAPNGLLGGTGVILFVRAAAH